MPYLNIDTEIGIAGIGSWPYPVKSGFEGEAGSAKMEIWADDLDVPPKGTDVDGIRVYPAERPEYTIDEEGTHYEYDGEIGGPTAEPVDKGQWADTVTFDPKTLRGFVVWSADPNITVVKDGEVLARNVASFDARPLLWRKEVQVGLGIAGVAIATGFVGRWLDWW